MPYKTFAVNEILTAADVNEYLMDQAVMSFAGTAARGSAIASPSEGMVSYLDDSNQLELFDGSNWVGLAGASVGTATPASTAEGDFWLDTDPSDGQVLKAYNSGWKNVGPLSGNAIINGDFGVWQRGTSFGPTTSNQYSADRWYVNNSGATSTVSRESFTPAELTAIGYGDAEFYLKMDVTTGDNFAQLWHLIEDARTFAGQTVTLSFWAKGTNPGAGSFNVDVRQEFGSGGSSSAIAISTTQAISATWTRYSFTITVPSVSGKTIGTGSYLRFGIGQSFGDTSTDAWELDLWGVQLEAGSVATPFRLAGGGSKAAELALCQRYYYKLGDTSQANQPFGSGYANSTTQALIFTHFPGPMRTRPTALEQTGTGSDYEIIQATTSVVVCSSVPTYAGATIYGAYHFFNGLTGLTTGQGLIARSDNGYLAWEAEL